MTDLNVTLASTLLELEVDRGRKIGTLKTGIKALDREVDAGVWERGIVGVGGVDGDDDDEINNGRLFTANILATRLLTSLDSASATITKDTNLRPRVFLLCPPNTSTLPLIHSVISKRLVGKNATPESTALSLLNDVSVLQYLDLTGLAESISEVSSLLHDNAERETKAALVYIEGLSATLSTSLNRSASGVGFVQIAALLSGLMRSIRSWKATSILMEVGVGVSSVASEDGEGLRTAFADEKGRGLVVQIVEQSANVSGTVRAAGSMLGKILESSVDGLVVVHSGFRDGERKRVVEVVKDGIGGGFGTWALWDDG